MTEEKIIEQIAQLKSELAKNVNLTVKEAHAKRNKIRSLAGDYNDLLIKGCKPCKCGKMPMGLHSPKTIQFKDENGKATKLNGFYEIGCVYGCINELSLAKGELRRQNLRTFALSREQAVENWNNKKFFLRIYPAEKNVIVVSNQ